MSSTEENYIRNYLFCYRRLNLWCLLRRLIFYRAGQRPLLKFLAPSSPISQQSKNTHKKNINPANKATPSNP